MITNKIAQNMEVIGADGVHVGTVDGVATVIRLANATAARATRDAISSTSGWSPTSRQRVRLAANAAVAVTFEEERWESPSGRGRPTLATRGA
jgi:hypothetical protein